MLRMILLMIPLGGVYFRVFIIMCHPSRLWEHARCSSVVMRQLIISINGSLLDILSRNDKLTAVNYLLHIVESFQATREQQCVILRADDEDDARKLAAIRGPAEMNQVRPSL